MKEKQSAAQTDAAHQSLLQQLGPLEAEVKTLTTERDEWENAVGRSIEDMRAEIEKMRKETSECTDNIYNLEAHLDSLAGGDKETMEMIRQECYGDLYVEGEGLADLDEL